MGYLMSLNNLKKVLAVGTVLSIAACLVPESAQAGIFKSSGKSGNSSNINFYLDTSIKDTTGNDDSQGVFPGAIQNFDIQSSFIDFTNSNLCGKDPCPRGNLTVTKFQSDANGNIPGIEFTLAQLQELIDSFPHSGGSSINLSNNVLRYDVTFDGTTSSDPELVWFIQSDDLSLINDLSALDKYKTIQAQGILFGDISIDDDGSAGSNGGVFNLTLKIPEPSTQAGLLGIGAFGALLLLKNKLRLRKPF